MSIYYAVKKNDWYTSHKVGCIFTPYLYEAHLYARETAAKKAADHIHGEVAPVRLELIMDSMPTVSTDATETEAQDAKDIGDEC